MDSKLVASCGGTLEAAEKLINRYFSSNFWHVYNKDGEFGAYNTVKGRALSDFSMGLELQKGRFRLVKYGDY